MIDSFVRNDSTVGAQANVNDNYGTISIGNKKSRMSATFVLWMLIRNLARVMGKKRSIYWSFVGMTGYIKL